MDTLDRAFLGTAAAGVAVLVAVTFLLSVAPADPVPATVLQALTGFHPAAALGRARARYQLQGEPHQRGSGGPKEGNARPDHTLGQSFHFAGRPATSNFTSTPDLSLHHANRRESRWLGIYDGLGLDHYSDRTLLIGPTFYAKLNELYWVCRPCRRPRVV